MITSVAVRIAEGGSKEGGLSGAGAPPGFRDDPQKVVGHFFESGLGFERGLGFEKGSWLT